MRKGLTVVAIAFGFVVFGAGMWFVGTLTGGREARALASVQIEEATTRAFVRGARLTACHVGNAGCDDGFTITVYPGPDGSTSADYKVVDDVIIFDNRAQSILSRSCTGLVSDGENLVSGRCTVHLPPQPGAEDPEIG